MQHAAKSTDGGESIKHKQRKANNKQEGKEKAKGELSMTIRYKQERSTEVHCMKRMVVWLLYRFIGRRKVTRFTCSDRLPCLVLILTPTPVLLLLL